jgi:hypothetical protein
MSITFTRDDHKFLEAVGISAEPTFDETRLALAKRISKHQAPGQPPKVNPEVAKRQLIRLSLEKLLSASEGCEE